MVGIVGWNKPSIGWHKLNTNGASIGNPSKAGGGGVIRDCHGVWVRGTQDQLDISLVCWLNGGHYGMV